MRIGIKQFWGYAVGVGTEKFYLAAEAYIREQTRGKIALPQFIVVGFNTMTVFWGELIPPSPTQVNRSAVIPRPA